VFDWGYFMHAVTLNAEANLNCPADVLEMISDGIYILNGDGVITYWNKSAEKITGYSAGEVIGSRCMDNILVHMDENGNAFCGDERCPAFDTIKTGRTNQVALAYLHSKSGYRIPVRICTTPLIDEVGRCRGALEIFSEMNSREGIDAELEEMRKLALLDSLTGVGNRRFGQIRLQSLLNQFNRYKWPFGVIFCDIDDFKKFNDNYGHDFGDKVLKMISQTLISNIRSFDCVVRWGGEEFLVILVNIKSEYLNALVEKLRILVESSYITRGQENIRVTISVGSTLCQPQDTFDSIVARADQLMYRSKEKGKNRITFD
jgi:diguanylate cyclase (GGDEF)-like protein/PAS domain S-box-containing protein